MYIVPAAVCWRRTSFACFRTVTSGIQGQLDASELCRSNGMQPGCIADSMAHVKVANTVDEARSLVGVDKAHSIFIGTHDGTFHCDEALACSMLLMLSRYQQAVIVRSRDPEVLKDCHVVVDVGAIYDPKQHCYDHHQRDFDGSMSELGHKTKLSSAGLVYRHFGLEVLETYEIAAAVDYDALYRKLYKGFIEHIDGIDNGIEAFAGARNYDVSTTLSDRVSALNPRWNEPSDSKESNARFCTAVQLTGREFAAAMQGYALSWWPARALVAAALDGAASLHPSRQILELESPCPWAAHLFELEEERTAAGRAKYVIFPDSRGAGYRIQAVAAEEGSFTSRRALPEPWRGLRDAKLSELTGIEGCIFVHAGGFIGGNATRQGALAMALKSIAGSEGY